MGHEGNEANKEQYVDNQYVRERLMVSRTKAYEIMRADRRGLRALMPSSGTGECLRVRKDVFFRWVSEHCGEEQHPCANAFITRWWAAPHLRSVG